MSRLKSTILLAMLLAIPACVNTPAETTATSTEKKHDPNSGGLAVNTPNMPKLAVKGDIEDIIQFYPGDDESVYVTINNPSGIGHVTLDRVGERWPPMITFVISHDPAHHFAHVESFTVTDSDKKVLFTAEKNAKLPIEWTIPEDVKPTQITINWHEASP